MMQIVNGLQFFICAIKQGIYEGYRMLPDVTE